MAKVSKELFSTLSLIDSFKRMANRTKIQKLTFIAKEKFDYKISFNFVSYHYGPYSPELRDFIDDLIRDGLLEERKILSGIIEYSYSLTPLGEKVLEDMRKSVDRESLNKINSVVKLCLGKSTREIISIAKKLVN